MFFPQKKKRKVLCVQIVSNSIGFNVCNFSFEDIFNGDPQEN